MQHYDAIVIGTGAVGSAAVYHLAKRGARVLGVDRFAPPHDRGSSHGATRMIRQAYFEHPDYVPLLLRAYELWAELENAIGRHLFEQTGLIEIGPADGVVVPGILTAAREHALPVETVAEGEFRKRFPGLVLPPSYIAVFEPTAGYLHVEACIEAHLELARRAGAEIRSHATAIWRPDGAGVRVDIDGEAFAADRCVVTSGAWSGELLTDLDVTLEVRRKPLYWYRVDDPQYTLAGGMSCFFYELPQGQFYGFPAIDDLGLKLARHDGGAAVADPLDLDRSPNAQEQEDIANFLGDHLPGVSRECTQMQVCMYTMSPDDHFVLDLHPTHPQIALAAGLSGHGFKFACVLGEALAELALDGQSRLPVDFLSLARFRS